MLGAHLMVELLNQGKTVKAMRRASSDLRAAKLIFDAYANAEASWERIQWVTADLLDMGSIDDMLDDVRELYHCAAMVSFNPDNKQRIMKVNVEGTANLLHAVMAKGGISFCHVSSVAALGNSEKGEEVTEETHWKKSPDHSVYSVSKYFSEQEVWRAITEGLDAVIVNPSIILGPGSWDAGSSELFLQVWKGFPFYTKGMTGYVDVRDVVKAMALLMEKKRFGERYLLSAENLSYRQLFDWIAEDLGKKKPHIHVKAPLAEIAWRVFWLMGRIRGKMPAITKETARSSTRLFLYSSEKIKSEFGFEFIPIRQSIHDISKLFLAQHS